MLSILCRTLFLPVIRFTPSSWLDLESFIRKLCKGREFVYLLVPDSDQSFNCPFFCPFSLAKKHLGAR